jgi:hypothetical protein
MVNADDLQRRLDVLEVIVNQQYLQTEKRFEHSDAALRVALDANNKRLDGMNEFRDALNDTTNRMITRVEAISVVQAVDQRNNLEIVTLRDKLNESSKPNYVLFITALSALFAVITGIWLVIGLKIESTVSPITLSVATLQSHNVVQDQELSSLSNDYHDLQATITANSVKSAASDAAVAQLTVRVSAQATAILDAEKNKMQQAEAVSAKITRINIWLDFIHEKLFPGQQIPLQQTP